MTSYACCYVFKLLRLPKKEQDGLFPGLILSSRHWEIMPVTLSASFGSGEPDEEILRCAQDDSQETSPLHDFPSLCFCAILSMQLNS